MFMATTSCFDAFNQDMAAIDLANQVAHADCNLEPFSELCKQQADYQRLLAIDDATAKFNCCIGDC